MKPTCVERKISIKLRLFLAFISCIVCVVRKFLAIHMRHSLIIVIRSRIWCLVRACCAVLLSLIKWNLSGMGDLKSRRVRLKPIIKTLFLSQVLIIYVNLSALDSMWGWVEWAKGSCITAKAKALLRLLNEANTHGHFRASHVQITQNINLTMNYLKIELQTSSLFLSLCFFWLLLDCTNWSKCRRRVKAGFSVVAFSESCANSIDCAKEWRNVKCV